MAAESTTYFSATLPGLDAAAGDTSSVVRIDQNKATVIQQVGGAIGTGTLEVSNSGSVFSEFHSSTTNFDIMRPIVISNGYMPWKFIRIRLNSGGTGVATFEIQQKL